jgi:putative intracellular protease/amidase
MEIRLLSADDYDLLLLPGVKAAEAIKNQQAALAIAERFFAGN